MKVLIIALITISAFSLNAQTSNNRLSLQHLLTSYYDLKDAMVNADATTTISKSVELIKSINSVDGNLLTKDELKAFSVLKEKLLADAKNITDNKSIERQRAYFSSLSSNFSSLAKAIKLTNEVVYEQYCPMKKSYWLSNEASIKNPYYGKSMLTCGKVTSTIK